MAVVQISKIQLRRGRKNSGTGLPQLASGEMAWAIDTQELYIGNGAVSEGAPAVGNTKILTEHDNILDLLEQYTYRPDEIETGTSRTLQQRLDEGTVNAKSFGVEADVDGDQTDKIQAAIYNLYLVGTANDRVALEFDPGTYKITGTLYIPGYVRLIGSGIDNTTFNFVKGGINSGTTLTLDGTSVTTAGTYTNLTTTTLSGTGTGCVVTVAKTGTGTTYIGSGVSKNVTITIVNPGSGYASGDQIKVSGSDLGGNSANDLTITLSSTAVNPTFDTDKVFEFVNSSSTITQRNVQTTSYCQPAKNILFRDFTVKTNNNTTTAFDLVDVIDSEFTNVKAKGTWASGLPTDSSALKMTSTYTGTDTIADSGNSYCQRNRFRNFRTEGFSYGVYSITKVIHNEFDACVFKTGYEGIRFGDSGVVGSLGPRRNVISNSLFDHINRYGIIVDVGYGNRSNGNTFVTVGTDGGSTPVCGQIKFTTPNNSSVQDYFDRTDYLQSANFGVAYYPEVEGTGGFTDFAPRTIGLPYRTIPTQALKIPLQNTTSVDIDYVFQSTTYAQMRKGTISIAIDKNNTNLQLVDDYEYVGAAGQDTNITFTGSIVTNAGQSSVIVYYTNSSAGDLDNTFTYTIKTLY
jgi:hypothetical protein